MDLLGAGAATSRETVGARDELFQRLADALSADIAVEMIEVPITPKQVVNRLVPRGTPGSHFHRPALEALLQSLVEDDVPLDLVTCLQIAETFGWEIGLLSEEDPA